MENINLNKYSRFFAFGCSFTEYYWPTWANIIAKEIPDHYIYAKIGAGNFFIFQALIEAIVRHSINKDDLVMIMFSNITREDRYTKEKGWITPGNLYFQTEYNEKFLKKYLCHKGYLMRDLSLVSACKHTLDNIGCNYELMSIVPFDSESSNDKRIDDVTDVLDFYKDIITCVKPSVLETVFDNNWNARLPRPTYKVDWQIHLYQDNHPTPAEHMMYLESLYPDLILSEETKLFVKISNEKVMAGNLDNSHYHKNLCQRL